ncbi:hypothetical protein [Saccharospirillum salsuginis]|uniref:Uncharacterized protein n=1 Tax=Saccharospirillum salsuginis TaxID=418750 RepID=A0A918N5N2_9GAMM|nr:hypothetical protein [Saccharospirillum salsuginis]GGX39585.1 hypothetical protein GCM10007392_02530 [Saccharospirillum salsuginis]
MKLSYVRLHQALLVLSLLLAVPAAFIADRPQPWWGVIVAALPMALHFTVRLSFKAGPRKRWLMPQQVFTLGGLGLTINPEVIEQPSWLATALATALVVALYVYLFKVWRVGPPEE